MIQMEKWQMIIQMERMDKHDREMKVRVWVCNSCKEV